MSAGNVFYITVEDVLDTHALNKTKLSTKPRLMQEKKISDRIRLVQPATKDDWPHPVDPENILVILLPWLNSKEKHVSKYVQLYLDQGLDVLCLQSKPQDFLWPPSSFSVAKHLSQVLQQCKQYNHYIIHSMSIGSYNLTTFRVLAKDLPEVAQLLGKVRGIIYDSFVIGTGKGGVVHKSQNDNSNDDAEAMDRFVRGIVGSVTKSKVILSLVSLVAKVYFSVTKKTTLDYYEKAYSVVRDEPVKVPTLIFTSDNDPMCNKGVVEQMVSVWENDHGVPITCQIWKESAHAQHLMFHRKEYLDIQHQFLDGIFSSLDSSHPPVMSKL